MKHVLQPRYHLFLLIVVWCHWTVAPILAQTSTRIEDRVIEMESPPASVVHPDEISTMAQPLGSHQAPRQWIPFNVLAGATTGGAFIRTTPNFAILHFPGVHFPPGVYSSVVQSLALPPELIHSGSIEVLFTSEFEEPLTTDTHTVLVIGQSRVSIGGGHVVTSNFHVPPPVRIQKGKVQSIVHRLFTQQDLLSIEIGRKASDNPEDTFPGTIVILGVRLTYTPSQ